MDSWGGSNLGAGKKLLSRLLWNQLLIAARDTKLKDKKKVKYLSIMIRFALMLQSKINKGSNDFVPSVFNLLTSRLVANYGSVNCSARDGIMFGTLRLMKKRLMDSICEGRKSDLTDSKLQWIRMSSLFFDAMSIKNKVKFDMHLKELIVFEVVL